MLFFYICWLPQNLLLGFKQVMNEKTEKSHEISVFCVSSVALLIIKRATVRNRLLQQAPG